MSDFSLFLRFLGPKIVILSPISMQLGNNMYFMPTYHIKNTPSKNIKICGFNGQKSAKKPRRDTLRAARKRP